MSTTVAKALGLLDHFTPARAELGLSELSRLAKADKATVHRMLAAMAGRGLLEQDERSRLYRLGASVTRLARAREAAFPASARIADALRALAAATGETAHAALISGESLAAVGVAPGNKPVRATLEAGEILPFHATASGLVCLAFLPDGRARAILKHKRQAFTGATMTSLEPLRRAVAKARAQGYAASDQGYEAGVYGIAAPLFSPEGWAAGAIGVATPAARMTGAVKRATARAVMDSALAVTRKLGGEPPPDYLKFFAKDAA